jgi:hypothetical protein
MKRFMICAALALVPVAMMACEKKDEGGGASPATSASVAIDDKDVPVPADYAEEAESIGNDDYKAKLEELSAEIDKDDK